jgi:hypothetical protein
MFRHRGAIIRGRSGQRNIDPTGLSGHYHCVAFTGAIRILDIRILKHIQLNTKISSYYNVHSTNNKSVNLNAEGANLGSSVGIVTRLSACIFRFTAGDRYVPVLRRVQHTGRRDRGLNVKVAPRPHFIDEVMNDCL